jgi:biopolymer transport protein ExbD
MIKKQRRPIEEINSSSMADIAFLLLVFFLVTTTISMDKGISLVLPSEGNELEVNRKNIVNILINESGKVLLDDRPTKVNAISGIVERKLSRNSNLIFSVQTHPRTKYQDYIRVLDQLKEAKATKISIANPPAF